jgi:hypothetical protein
MSIRGLARGQKGQALILALILLVIGGLIMAPLLAYMSTGIIAGGAYENKADELYAADAGAEDAVWRIQHQTDDVHYLYCGQGNHTLSYNINDVNGKSVGVTIRYVSSMAYNLTSIATGGGGSGTRIDAYVTAESQYGDFSGILNHVITSVHGYTTKPGDNITYPEGAEPKANYGDAWPTPQDLEGFYWHDVSNGTPYASGTIDLNGNNMTIGPLYRNGPLDIRSSSSTRATLTLNGTLYITGDTTIYGPGSSEPFKLTLDLNGNTIFVASGTSKYAINIDKCNIIGPGVIIAVGGVYFAPKSPAGDTDPIFVMSVLSQTEIQPQGDFYGAVAGNVSVTLQPNTTLSYPQGGFGSSDLNFPTGIQYLVYSITSWQVKPA